MSGEVVLMTLMGGLGTIFGPVVGAFVIVGMQTYLSALEQWFAKIQIMLGIPIYIHGLEQWVSVIQGVIFVACVLLFRRGVVGELAHLLRIRL